MTRKILLVLIIALAVIAPILCLGCNIKVATPAGNTDTSSPVAIISHNSYVSWGTYYVDGEVQNTSSDNLRFVYLTATFYKKSGSVVKKSSVVATSFGYTAVDILKAQQKSPFSITLTDEALVSQVDHYKVAVSDYLITIEEPYRDFQILSHNSYVDTIGTYWVTGEVQNTGSQAASFVRALATFYDDSGAVVATNGYGFTEPSTLAAGQAAPFRVMTLGEGLSAKIARYELQVDCLDSP